MTTLEKVAYLKMFLPPDAPISDVQIQFFVERWEAQLINTTDNDYVVIYNALVDSVRWIILQESSRNVGGCLPVYCFVYFGEFNGEESDHFRFYKEGSTGSW